MKTNRILTAVLAVVAFVSFVGITSAQYKPTGADGITASPKAREAIDAQQKVAANAPASAREKMACPMCKDRVTKRVDYTARGANKPVVKAVTHLCGGCTVERTVTGVGKARTEVATHNCTDCGAEILACCNTAKDGTVATKGMEKEINIAPLK